jgi:DisA bacterial checkpoint controller nucleotide-binding
MLVVHRNASEEAARLIPQAQQVLPQLLDSKLLPAVTSIDGAVLVDPTGTCRAVGVILDGHASGKGDSSRGARFNSAVRYHETQNGECLVIIVSEDGMINLLPNLRRQVARGSVEAVVRQLEESLTDDPDYEVFFRHWEHLESLAFYLTAEQCDRINAARTRLEDHRARPDPDDRDPNEGLVGRITHVGWTPFAPDPEMNSSYFLDAE